MAKIVKAKIRSPKIKNKKTFEELIPIEINTIDSELISELIVVDHIDPDVEAFVVAEEAVEEVVAVVEPVKKKNYLNNKDLLNQVLISKKQGSMTNLLAHMLQTLCRRYAKKGNFANYCVDTQTQALTKNGWVSYDQITKDDYILSYDIGSKKLVWSELVDVFVYDYSGNMHHMTTEGLNSVVSPGHKVVSSERGLIPVEDVICNEHIILMGDPIDDVTKIYEDAAVEIIGWCITEGHYSTKSKKKHSIQIAQKVGVKADRIRSRLIEASIPFKEYLRKNEIIIFSCTGIFISNVHQILAPKRVLDAMFILNLPQSQRLLLIETMISGDGWYRPNQGMSYCQKDEAHIDSFLMLCTLAGQTTYTFKQTFKTPKSGVNLNGGTSECFVVNLYQEPKKQCKAEWIDFHGGKQGPGGRRENKPNLPILPYEGKIWCPQTKYGTFVCRRHGYIHITGNSYNEDMQGYAMLMLVKTWDSFKPEKSKNPFAFFTQCIKHSFIQYLKQERRQRDVKNEILIDNGLNPSHSYTLEYENDQFEKRQALFDDDSSTNNKDDFIPFVPIEYMDPTEVQEEAAEVSEVR